MLAFDILQCHVEASTEVSYFRFNDMFFIQVWFQDIIPAPALSSPSPALPTFFSQSLTTLYLVSAYPSPHSHWPCQPISLFHRPRCPSCQSILPWSHLVFTPFLSSFRLPSSQSTHPDEFSLPSWLAISLSLSLQLLMTLPFPVKEVRGGLVLPLITGSHDLWISSPDATVSTFTVDLGCCQ